MASIPQGAIRFNTDSQKLEFYAQDQWFVMMSENVGLGTGGDTGAGARGVFFSGYTTTSPNTYNRIDYINIASTGHAIDFGDTPDPKWGVASCSSSTRGVIAGGYPVPAPASNNNFIEFITISSTGDAQDFGDLTYTTRAAGSCSSSTRGIFTGGYAGAPAQYNDIDYITIASTGDAKDFGDATFSGSYKRGCSNATRGVFGGGGTPTVINTIEFITISTLGDAKDFGDLTVSRDAAAACSNSTRGVFGGGSTPTIKNDIDFIIISTLGNAVNFGDLSGGRHTSAAVSSPTRGVWGGGMVPAASNIIEYITILTQGNAVDFGDLTIPRGYMGSCSNAHGGL